MDECKPPSDDFIQMEGMNGGMNAHWIPAAVSVKRFSRITCF